jgi:hypothetical protein
MGILKISNRKVLNFGHELLALNIKMELSRIYEPFRKATFQTKKKAVFI